MQDTSKARSPVANACMARRYPSGVSKCVLPPTIFSENHSLGAHGEDTAKMALSLFEKTLSLPCTRFAVGPRSYSFGDVPHHRISRKPIKSDTPQVQKMVSPMEREKTQGGSPTSNGFGSLTAALKGALRDFQNRPNLYAPRKWKSDSC